MPVENVFWRPCNYRRNGWDRSAATASSGELWLLVEDLERATRGAVVTACDSVDVTADDGGQHFLVDAADGSTVVEHADEGASSFVERRSAVFRFSDFEEAPLGGEQGDQLPQAISRLLG